MKNVLFILTDDQRAGTIHALGNPDICTPNLDWLAGQGTVFQQAHIPGGTSGAVCMPSRAMLLTGRTLFHLQGEGQDIPCSHVTMPEVFQRAGYDCFGTGKWHNGPPAFSRGFTGGSNIFFGGMWDHWNVPVCRYDPTGEYDNVINFTADFCHTNQVRRVHCDHFNPGVHSSELLTSSALEYLQARPKDKPFFLYLSYLAPHDPRTMPERFHQMYDPDSLTLPDNCMAEHPFPIGIEGIRDERLAASPRTDRELRQQLADYYGMISHLDSEIGRVLDYLRENDLWDDTIVVFTADNGLSMGSHGLMGKQNNYEESVRVPLILAGGGLPGGQTRDGYLYLLDIFPTLCELLGLPVPASVEGESFAAALTGNKWSGRPWLYFAYNELMRAVKEDGCKLIEYRGPQTHTQLFDLSADPGELHDIAAQRPELVQKLRTRLRRCAAQWEDSKHPYSKAFWDRF